MNKNTDYMDDFLVSRRPSINAHEEFIKFKKIKSLFNTHDFSKSEIIDRGLIKDENDLASFYALLNYASTNGNNRLYRKSENSNNVKCLIWMATVKKTASTFLTATDVPTFSGIGADFLSSLAKLSVDETIPISLPHILAENGIILIYEPSFRGMKLDGVVFRLENGNPVIGMSLRYPRLDYFWFTLMHELAHIHLHLNRLDEPIFDDLDMDDSDTIEVQANRLAKSSFIPRSIWRNCAPKYQKSDEVLIKFSEEIGIHPAIVAGMLRKEENSYTMYSRIVNKINVRDMVFNYD